MKSIILLAAALAVPAVAAESVKLPRSDAPPVQIGLTATLQTIMVRHLEERVP